MAEGTLDTSFETSYLGFNSTVRAIVKQSDGKIIVAGDFNTYNGSSYPRIIRFKTDGTVDDTFSVGTGFTGGGISSTSGVVNALALDASGNILVGGSFTGYNGSTAAKCLARLFPNGTLDTSLNLGTGFAIAGALSINTIAVEATGNILVGGSFTTYNGTTCLRIARLNSLGTIQPFTTGSTGFNTTGAVVYKIALQSDGKILVGGSFTSYQYAGGTATTNINRIARLTSSGQLDPIFGTGFTGGTTPTVFDLVVDSIGNIIVGGAFTTYNSSTPNANNIIRLASNGSIDPTFNIGSGIAGSIYSLGILSNGSIILGGSFTSYNGTNINNIVRVSSTGGVSTSFVTNAGSAAGYIVRALLIDSSSTIVLGGEFVIYNGTNKSYIARISNDGLLDNNSFIARTNTNSTISKVATLSDGRVVVVGIFFQYNRQSRLGIALLTSSGLLDTSFNPGTGFSIIPVGIGIQSTNKIIVCGSFTLYNGTAATYIARVNSDGTLDTSFNNTGITGSSIQALRVLANDKILIGGRFTQYNGKPAVTFARLNSDGSLDETFNAGTGFSLTADSITINDIVVQSDNKILVGGVFDSYNGNSRNNIVRLNENGEFDATFNASLGTPATSTVSTIALASNNRILIGGSFTSPKNYLACLTSTGELDTSFNSSGTNTTGFSGSNVKSIAIQWDNKIVIGGSFGTYNGVSALNILRLNDDGSRDTNFSVGVGASGAVNSTIIQPSGKVLIAGAFTVYNTISTPYIARLIGTPPTQPGIPTLSSTVASGDTSITIYWSAPASNGATITAYNVQYKTNLPNDAGYVSAPDAITTSATISPLTDNVIYTFSVRAVNSVGSSVWSNEVTGETVTAPTAPRNVTATGDIQKVTLNWSVWDIAAGDDDGGDQIDGFHLYYKRSSDLEFEPVIDIQDHIADTWVVESLEYGTSYDFKLAAYNGVDPSDGAMAVTSATTFRLPTISNTGVTIDAGKLTLSWSVTWYEGAPVSYTITDSNNNSQTFDPLPLPATAYQREITGLTNGVSYTYNVKVTSTVGDSATLTFIGTPLLPAITPTSIDLVSYNQNTQKATVKFVFTPVVGAVTYKLIELLPDSTENHLGVSSSSPVEYEDANVGSSLSYYIIAYDVDNRQITRYPTSAFSTVIPCLPRGTPVLTPTGYRLVEEFADGDLVVTEDGRAVPVKVHRSGTTCSDAKSAPVRIAARSFFGAYPVAPIRVSSWHAFKVGSGNAWMLPKDVIGVDGVVQEPFGQTVEYYHFELPDYLRDNLVLEGGAVVESYGIPWKQAAGLWGKATYVMDKTAGFCRRIESMDSA